jgi:SecD/SecF fusion protein
LFLVLVVLVAFGYSIFPPEKQLRLGKDLRGGVSMVYSVQIDPNEDAKEVMSKTIDVLKRRVDPDGLLEISMVAQGRDRIEITMPLPSARVKGLRKEFEDALAELGRNRLSESRLDATMAMSPEQRSTEIARFAGANTTRKAQLEELASLSDRTRELQKRYADATDAAAKEAAAGELASAEIALEAKRDAIVSAQVTAAEIRKIVLASTRARVIDDNGARVSLPSPRQAAEEQVRGAHPDSKDEIDRLLALHQAYAAERTTLDDPNDLIRALKGAGVLSFRIAVQLGNYADEGRVRDELQKVGPRNVKAADVRWYKINQIERFVSELDDAKALAADPGYSRALLGRMGYVVEPYAGDFYMLCYDTRLLRITQAEGTWSVSRATMTADERGRPAVGFDMNPSGAVLMARLTGANVSRPMAVLLDDEVYTAPNLLEEIGASGRISGEFSPEEVNYIVRVLSGGSLQAKLSPEPISINSVGPELGADNLERGFDSGKLSMVLVAVFMVFYYFVFGGVAVVALLANAILIVGAMAISKASFTMPGIAGVILTFGAAVDSNVLVFERIREEMNRGADLRTAVRLGFDKALSAIVDGNVTNLIVCIVLYYTGTPEIRGFAITMGIGVVSTLFAALVISRLIFNLMIAAGWRKASMLPMAVPKLQQLLTPSVDWLKYRYVFFTISAIYVGLGLLMVFGMGSQMLDNEFRGGTQVVLRFKPDPASAGQRMTMSREDVEDRVHALGKEAPPDDFLRDLASAEVFPIDPRGDGVTSDRFAIKTIAPNTNSAVLDAVRGAFADVLDTKPALQFAGSGASDVRSAPVYSIDKATLGENIARAGARQSVAEYLGGVAIVLEKIEPPTSLASLQERLGTTRASQQFSDTLARKHDVVILEGTEERVVSAALLSADETASIFENEQRWESEVRDREWALAQEALTKASTPASVLTFSPAIADTFRANAITATIVAFIGIAIYIWVRFKAPRYSLAAVIALIHDVLVVIGLIALADWLYLWNDSTRAFAQSVGLLPFKIDLNMVAALLTIAGYSLNDTVVIMDRIRENRGKLPYASKEIINLSINQTFSRTLITGGTTLGSCIILYLIGGEGMRAFAFALTTGLIVGTYSSVAVAAPIVWSRKHEASTQTQPALA